MNNSNIKQQIGSSKILFFRQSYIVLQITNDLPRGGGTRIGGLRFGGRPGGGPGGRP